MSFLHRILGRNQNFPKDSLSMEVTFLSEWEERVLERNLNFLISSWGRESDF